MFDSVLTLVFALGVIYTIGVAISFAYGSDIRAGYTLRRQRWYDRGPEPSVAELEREKVVGTRMMLVCPFWPITLAALVLICIGKILQLVALQGAEIAASLARIAADALRHSKR